MKSTLCSVTAPSLAMEYGPSEQNSCWGSLSDTLTSVKVETNMLIGKYFFYEECQKKAASLHCAKQPDTWPLLTHSPYNALHTVTTHFWTLKYQNETAWHAMRKTLWWDLAGLTVPPLNPMIYLQWPMIWQDLTNLAVWKNSSAPLLQLVSLNVGFPLFL